MATNPSIVDTAEAAFFGGQLADSDPQVDAAIEALASGRASSW